MFAKLESDFKQKNWLFSASGDSFSWNTKKGAPQTGVLKYGWISLCKITPLYARNSQ